MSGIVIFILFIFSIIQINTEPSGLRIIGGRDADEDKYPYIVRLEIQIVIVGPHTLVQDAHSCTGAVVTPTWILTAAHCLDIKEPKMIKNVIIRPIVRHGAVTNNTVSKVLYSIIHPAFKLRMFDLHNDIGLIKTEAITLDRYAHVSAIDFNTLVGQEVTLTGYGITNSSKGLAVDATTAEKPLQMLDVVVVQCDKEMLATVQPAVCLARRCGPSSGICPGDSGGPMLHSSGVIGVNSIGSKDLQNFCALKSTPPIYDIAVITPTSPYIDWIGKIIKNDVPLPSKKK